MPKPSVKAEINTFVQGLITEASPLNFPPNASLDEENFELNREGSRSRRLGMDYEDSNVNHSLAITLDELIDNPPSTFKWMNVNGESTKNFLVVQTGNVITFFDMANEPLSDQTVSPLTLSLFPVDVKFSFTSVDGKLIIAAGQDTIAVIDYTSSVFNTTYERLLTRDVWGVEVTDIPEYETDVSYRGAYSELHSYNLKNQSWGIPRRDLNNNLVDPVSVYDLEYTKQPSNSEAVWAGLQVQAVATGQIPFERVYPELYEQVLGASIKTARGYFIIDALRRGQSRIDKYAGNVSKYPILVPSSVSLPSDLTVGGASVVGEFAGRVFFGGFTGEVIDGDVRSPNLSNIVFFSQLVKSRPDIIKCYQEGDPTSRDSSDVVDTDGGFIRVSGMDKPLAFSNLGSHLLIIATNGVWAISGGNDSGFSATNFKTDKISNYGGLSDSSVVEISGKAAYWSEDGIYFINRDQFGAFQVNSATETTIQTYYESLNNTTKAQAVGCYDSIGKKVRWFYREGDMFSNTSEMRELVFDLVLNAFSKNRIYNEAQDNVEITSVFSSVQFKTNNGFEEVFSGSDLILHSSDVVIVPDAALQTALQSTRYLTISLVDGIPYYTFSYYWNEDFEDWLTYADEGVDALAYLLTGAVTGGDSSVPKQVPYLTMHFYRTERGVDENLVPLHQSSCLVRSQWEWANSINSNKFGPLWEVYRQRRAYLATDSLDPYDTGFQLVTSKTKLRGRGRAFSMYLETSPGKDCRIVGWNLAINGNQTT